MSGLVRLAELKPPEGFAQVRVWRLYSEGGSGEEVRHPSLLPIMLLAFKFSSFNPFGMDTVPVPSQQCQNFQATGFHFSLLAASIQ